MSGKNIGGVSGTATNDATATSSDILSGRTAYVKGSKITGNIVNKGSITATLSNDMQKYTISPGYYSGGTITANITNLRAIYIKKGINVGGVIGTYEGESGLTLFINTSSRDGAFTVNHNSSRTITLPSKPKLIISRADSLASCDRIWEVGSRYYEGYSWNTHTSTTLVLDGSNTGTSVAVFSIFPFY